MKYLLYGVILLLFVMIIIPSIIVMGFSFMKGNDVPHKGAKLVREGSATDIKDTKDFNTINVFVVKENRIIKMNLEDYLKGVVAAEMPAEFEEEALKAQAIAARTYALSKEIAAGGKGCELHPGADICTDYKHCQAWESNAELKEKWGSKYQEYMDKVSKAVDDTKGLVIVYQDTLIEPAYHAISGGKTEDSVNVWKSNEPYLKSVVSPGEENAKKFKTTVTVSIDEFIRRIKSKAPKAVLNSKNALSCIKNIIRTPAGHVESLKIGGAYLTGNDIKDLFNLNSTNFTFNLQGGNVVLTVIGYGHGVGMSQYGAEAMAKEGKNYEEILKHYYTGVEIKKFDDLIKKVFDKPSGK
ncbi:MAG: stage II sporulation protein D [Thermoanaerobacteraceae bacterium]|nr:stage II sporulation protein D [Thermoanaerobacteraceae bacterium]